MSGVVRYQMQFDEKREGHKWFTTFACAHCFLTNTLNLNPLAVSALLTEPLDHMCQHCEHIFPILMEPNPNRGTGSRKTWAQLGRTK